MKYLAAVGLQELTLPGATNKGLESIAQCASLVKLNVCGSQLEGDALKALAGMPNLKHLAATCTKIGNESFKGLDTLTSLRSLDLTGCQLIDDGAAKYLAKMTSLQHLELNSTQYPSRPGSIEDLVQSALADDAVG